MVKDMKKTKDTNAVKGNNTRKKRLEKPFSKFCVLVASLALPASIMYAVCTYQKSKEDDKSPKYKPVPMVSKKSEKQVAKEKVGKKCYANLAPVSCNLNKPLVRGIVTKTAPLKIGNLFLRLEAIIYGTMSADQVELTVLDSCGKILNNDKYPTVSPKVVLVNGAEYLININSTHIPHENGTKWADVTVWLSCLEPSCDGVSQILDNASNSYEISLGIVLVKFKGIKSDGKTRKAVLLVEDTDKEQKRTVEVKEGETKAVAKGYFVRVPAMGYNCDFGEVWAKVELSYSPVSN